MLRAAVLVLSTQRESEAEEEEKEEKEEKEKARIRNEKCREERKLHEDSLDFFRES